MRNPRPGPDLEHEPAGAGRRLAQDALEHVDVGEEVLRQVVAGAQARLLEPALHELRVEAQVARRVPAGRRRALIRG